MTEKRFIGNFQGNMLVSVKDTIQDRNVNILQIVEIANKLVEENEQLKERNKNQYEQLTQLWKLIENEDYNTLRSMLNQLEEDEERLQQEWRTYGDVE